MDSRTRLPRATLAPRGVFKISPVLAPASRTGCSERWEGDPDARRLARADRPPRRRQVAYRLNAMCLKMEGQKNFTNLRIDGRPVNLPEDMTLWSQFCGNAAQGEEPKTVIEFVFKMPKENLR